MKNILHYICIVFPEIILRSHHTLAVVPIHWKLSRKHALKLVDIIHNFYKKLADLFDIPIIAELITSIQRPLRKIYELISMIPLNKNTSDTSQAIFNKKLVKNWCTTYSYCF